MKMTSHELSQLRSIGNRVYVDRPYWWGPKTMPKLAAKGLVEPHPEQKRAWRITAAGKALHAELFSQEPTLVG
jgi:hypothetical protein